ncbi:MAG: cupredoxin domain-containing protein [Candidatus Promineifilaceae bacterium]
MKKLPILIVALAIMALLLAACGGGDSGPTTLSFEGADTFEYTPSSATVSAGDQVELTLNNAGALEHSWVLVPNDVDVATVSDADTIDSATTGAVPAGESKTITFTAPAAGTYKFVCTIPGHAAAGMVGTLTVN